MCWICENINYTIWTQESSLQLHSQSSPGERNGKFSQNVKFGRNSKLGQNGKMHLDLNVNSSVNNCDCAWSMAIALW